MMVHEILEALERGMRAAGEGFDRTDGAIEALPAL